MAAAPRRHSILLVEDEPSVALTLRYELEDHAHAVTHTGDGAEALRLLAERAFDAVITDLRIPGADGLQVVQAVHRWQPAARVLVISASFAGYATALQQLGAPPTLQKPFWNERVLAWLHAVA